MSERARRGVVLGLIVLGYLVLATLYATRVPPWNAPDEPAHYNYVRSLAVDHRLPILQFGDYDQAQIERLTSLHFPPNESIAGLRYESHQPPLYYLIAAPALVLTQNASPRTQVVALRLVTVGIGALFLLATYRLARTVFPKAEGLPLAATAFAAFVPMHLFMDAAIDNDALAELMLCLTLIVLVDDLWQGGKPGNEWRAGLAVGLAILTKLVAAVSALLVVGGFLGTALLARERGPALRRLPARLARSGLVALLVSGWWIARNVVVYGATDPFGLRRHAAVVVGQPLTERLTLTQAHQMLLTLFHSFWGQFGWMGVPYADRTYDVLATGSVLVALGIVLAAWQVVRFGRVAANASSDGGDLTWETGKVTGDSILAPPQRWALGLLVAEVALVVVGVVLYNLQYLQPQGRYLFPTLPALAIFAAAGIAELIRPRYVGLVFVLASLALVWLAIFSLFQVIGPAFAR